MGLHDAIAWSEAMDALVGTAPDGKVAAQLGLPEERVRYRRRKLGRPTYRSTRAPVPVECSTCGQTVTRPQKARTRSRRLYCSRECADAGQKRRDSETLRYGPGWKNRRAEIRRRDTVCRSCAKTPEENGAALHVHHLVPFRYGGTNRPENLVALCESCHHRIEALTDQVLATIRVAVTLDGPSLTITVDDEQRWPVSAPGAPYLTGSGSMG